jgi:glucose-6-phosphate 1-dehydrogenase
MTQPSKAPKAPEPHGEPAARKADPCTVVIFGASGDLTHRKLIPALFNLAAEHFLAEGFAVLGCARSQLTHSQFREKAHLGEKELNHFEDGKKAWAWLSERTYYTAGDVQDPSTYARIKAELARIDQTHKTGGNVVFYLATAPDFFAPIVEQLAAAGLTKEEDGGWRRVVIEKPFGHDLPTAQALNVKIGKCLDESQIFRIDHYLGKETVQNLMVFRFGNGIFEPIWNRRYIDHVQITVAESLGVEERGGYYDTAGALRDMTPNHIAQLVSLVGMEPPCSFAADAVRDEQVKLLRSIQPLAPEDVLSQAVRGQYGEGNLEGQHVPAYRAEEKVPPESRTETFVALKLTIDNWRWAGVPIYVRTGKRLPKRVTKIAIQFKGAPFSLFRKTAVDKLATNRLVIHVQPDEGISLRFGAKIPGPILRLGPVNMDFRYDDYFGATPSTGYETLLYDCMVGDATLFQRADMVENGWRMVQPLLDVWSAIPPRSFPNYGSGSWGPQEANDLIERDGRRWENF